MAGLTTHVLDTARGRPAAGMALELAQFDENGERRLLKSVRTNAEGRTDGPLLTETESARGYYGSRTTVSGSCTGQVRDLRPFGALPRSAAGLPVVLQHVQGELTSVWRR